MYKLICAAILHASMLTSIAVAQNFVLHPNLVYATYLDASNQPRNLLLDLYVPTVGPTPRPVIVWIHGGAWRGGSRAEIPPIATAMCAGGYAVASIDYRLSQTAIWPAQLHDCKGAVRWLRSQASRYLLDVHRFGVWGVSAGAQLATMLAVTGDVGIVHIGNSDFDLEGSVGGNLQQSSRVQAVCDWFGPSSFVRASQLPTPGLTNRDDANSPESLLVGGPVQEQLERCMSADPITFLSQDDPPMLVMHGTADTVAAFNQSELLADASQKSHGHNVQFVPVAGADHGDNPFYQPQVTIEVYVFFNTHLLQPRPLVSLSLADATAAEGGQDTARITVRRTGALAQPLRIRLATSGAAVAGLDYEPLPHWVTIPIGAASKDLDIVAIDDNLVEGTQAVQICLGPGPDYNTDVRQTAVTVQILDDEPTAANRVAIQASDDRAAETGNDSGTLVLSRTGPLTSALDVRLNFHGNASHGSDYIGPPASVTIPANAAAVTIPIVAIPDNLVEPSELVHVFVIEDANYAIAWPSAAVRIHDSPASAPIVSVTATDREAWEGTLNMGEFTILRTGSLASGLTVNIATGGIARPGSDYPSLANAVFFPAGSFAQTVPVQAFWDMQPEGDEELTVTILPGPGYRIGSQATNAMVIHDVDSQPAQITNPLTVDEFALGKVTTVQIETNPALGSAAYALYIAAGPTYLPTPFGVLAIDLSNGFQLASGMATGGSASLAFRLPNRPELVGGTLWLQCFTAGVNPLRIELSNPLSRRVGTR